MSPSSGLVPPVAAQGPGRMPAAAVNAMDLRLVRRAAGALPGEHRSPGVGTGTELAQLRPYQVGDDVRMLDPAASARTGEPHVRLQVPERALTTWVLLDRSASMAFGTAERLKSDVADGVTEVIGRLAIRRGGRFALTTCGAPADRILAPKGGRAALATMRRLVGEGVAPDGFVAPDALTHGLRRVAGLARQPGLVVVVSDFREEGTGWRRALRLVATRHRVLCAEVSDPRERALPDAGTLVVIDPETGATAEVDTSSAAVRERYAAAEAARAAEVRDAVRRAGAQHVALSTDGDWLRALGRALA
ncbi:MAG: DUF58 domain-containing protein [Solirubrobacterales bacterium]|nr:DUF58 domain-containing protein [Solirubrobacterales bacterium]